MAYIDTVLSGQGQVTPPFYAEQIGGVGHLGETLHLVFQIAHTTDLNTAVSIAIDNCLIDEAGNLMQMHNGTEFVDAWRLQATINVNSSQRTNMRIFHSIGYGTAFQLRYAVNEVTPVRVVVATPYRSED